MSDSIQPAFTDWVCQQLQCDSLGDVELLQQLWSGYGQCFRFRCARFAAPLVAKVIGPPASLSHPKGWSNPHSHSRKLTSYAVEQRFYQHNQALPGGPTMPALIHTACDGDKRLLVMSDLDHAGFARRCETLQIAEARTVLTYLADFHGWFLRRPVTDLWPRGTYWHLPTRQAEWQAMPNGPLKARAGALHQALAAAPFQTVVHGDAKVANFCFRPDMQACAAVDFQYVGQGTGVQDVAYFLGSALSLEDLQCATPALLDHYFNALHQALSGSAICAQQVEAAWRPLFAVACADFHRFLAGWSPQHWKINDWLKAHSDEGLARLSSHY